MYVDKSALQAVSGVTVDEIITVSYLTELRCGGNTNISQDPEEGKHWGDRVSKVANSLAYKRSSSSIRTVCSFFYTSLCISSWKTLYIRILTIPVVLYLTVKHTFNQDCCQIACLRKKQQLL